MLALRRRKLEAEALKLELANAQKSGELVSRAFVELHVMGLIDGTNRRLLGDGAKTIATRVSSMARGGASAEECHQAVREQISNQLARVKDAARRKLALAARYTNKDKEKRP
jgi:hypothetical protein